MQASKIIPMLGIFLVSHCKSAANSNTAGLQGTGVTPGWKNIFQCNGVHIDLDEHDRKSMQVVVTDKNLFDQIAGNIPYGAMRNESSQVYRGTAPFEVSSPDHFVTVAALDRKTGFSSKSRGFEAHRYGSSLVFRALEATKCGGSITLGSIDFKACEAWNYTFNGCSVN